MVSGGRSVMGIVWRTMVEFVVVLVIIGILSTLAIPKFQQAAKKAQLEVYPDCAILYNAAGAVVDTLRDVHTEGHGEYMTLVSASGQRMRWENYTCMPCSTLASRERYGF